MAIFHLTASVGSRAGGASAWSKYDYIAREGKYHSGAEEVLDIESGNMPEWAADQPREYWAAADAHERVNGQLYREMHVALPVQLDREQQKALARQFAADITARERLPYTLAIHEGRSRDPDKPPNPHAHLIWSDRGHDDHQRSAATWFKRYNGKAPEKGGARKSRERRNREWLAGVREQWAARVNAALERGGHEARVDHRKLWQCGRSRGPRAPATSSGPPSLPASPTSTLGPRPRSALERIAAGKAPAARRSWRTGRSREKNGVWDRLKAEIQRLTAELAELAREVKQLGRALGKARIELQQARQWQQARAAERGRDFGPSR